jgi:hypothetical protein
MISLEELKQRIAHQSSHTARQGAYAADPGAGFPDILKHTVVAYVVLDDGRLFVGHHSMPENAYDHVTAETYAFDDALGNAYEALTALEAYTDPLTADGYPDPYLQTR